MTKEVWVERVEIAKRRALGFTKQLESAQGYKYTLNHDVEKYPAAILYGTWSVAFIHKLLQGEHWKDAAQNKFILNTLNASRLPNGLFYPKELDEIKYSKSKEYMQLHCYNYAVGAALEIDPSFNFQSSYMDEFLNPSFLERWLNQRSLERPWEESNNIVNVASYLALCHDAGDKNALVGLEQMLDWHTKNQNPRTGGFENFSPTKKNLLQSMGGSVHNFHIHHYLNVPMNFEHIIANHLIPFLYEGPLTACLSIDFVELACRTICFLKDTYPLEQALLFHLKSLLDYQNKDGGWYENETSTIPTIANGMKEAVASSNAYATWFRLCSIGMIMLTLFDDDTSKWNFRRTLGMGYAPNRWNKINVKSFEIDRKLLNANRRKNLPNQLKKKAIAFAVKMTR